MSDLKTYDIPCSLGLEPVLMGELAALGAKDLTQRRGGVICRGDQALGYRACLWLRSAVRVQEILAEFEVIAQDDLYDIVRGLPWERWMTLMDTFAVDANVRDSAITHSGFAALRVKDAVVDRFRDLTGRRPDVDREEPIVPLHLRLVKGKASLARDLSGESLHKRGWRPIQVKSPLNEAVAAGLLLSAGYDGTGLLVDPMCGSATFLMEAALIATDRAPGLDRRFAFTDWPDFDRPAWRALVQEALDRQRTDVAARFIGVDRHPGAVAIAARSIQGADLQHLISVEKADCATWRPPQSPDWIFVNPPWGERLQDEVGQSWDALGEFLHGCPGAAAHVLSGSPELTQKLGLKSDKRWPVATGPVEAILLRYAVHSAPVGK